MYSMHDQELSQEQVIALTNAMISVATVDGLQPAEAALIGQFYESSRSAAMPATATLIAGAASHRFDASQLDGSTAEFADTLVLMCLMTAYADGRLSDGERQQVGAIAGALGMDAARLDSHLARVRDDLLGALSHLPDAGSVAAVVRELS